MHGSHPHLVFRSNVALNLHLKPCREFLDGCQGAPHTVGRRLDVDRFIDPAQLCNCHRNLRVAYYAMPPELCNTLVALTVGTATGFSTPDGEHEPSMTCYTSAVNHHSHAKALQ